jgi:hypothetical protein
MLQQFWRLVDCNSVLLIHLVKLIDANLKVKNDATVGY